MGRSRQLRPGSPGTISDPRPARDSRRAAAWFEALVPLGIVVVATMVAYSNTFDAPFVFDDKASILQNEAIRSFTGEWPTNRWVGFLSFAVNYRLGGTSPFGFHVTNLAIHVANALLVFWLTALTLRAPAVRSAEIGPLVRRYLPAAAALLFALHPLATQAVTYVVQRFASLATLFFLLSIALYAKARLLLEEGRRGRPAVLLVLSTLAAVAAMRTKEISFTLPLVTAGYEMLFFQRRRLVLVFPSAVAALLIPLGRIGEVQKLGDALGELGRLSAESPDIPRSAYALTQSRVVLTYLRLLVLPVGQNLDYDFPLSHSVTEPGVVAALAILAAIVGGAVFLLFRAQRTSRGWGLFVFFAVAWVFITLSVESSVIPIRDVIFEHRMYLPSAGAAVGLATGLLTAVERLRFDVALPLQAAATLALTAAPLGVATHTRNRVWRDEVVLWRDVVAKSPRKARPHYNLGNALLRRGAADEAAREYLVALELQPVHPEALASLGGAYVLLGQHDQAVAVLEKALAMSPTLVAARVNLGRAYLDRGETTRAIREFRGALELRPDDVRALSMLGTAYTQDDKLDEALAVLERATTLDPNDAAAHNNLGTAWATRGDLDRAAREYREAVRLDPSLVEPRSNLARVTERQGRARQAIEHNERGAALAARGRLEDAAKEYREAIRLDEMLSEAHTNLGVVLMRLGRAREAVEAHRRALALSPKPEIVFNLALALEASGRTRDAIAQYERFLDEASGKYPAHAESVKASIARLRKSLAQSR